MTPTYHRPPGHKPAPELSVEELRRQALEQSPEGDVPTVEQDPRKAAPTPFEQLDPDKQEEYASLVETLKTGELPAEKPKEADPLFTEQDKQDFIRSLIGGRPYTKKYTLFGTFEAMFADASLESHQKVYDELHRDPKQVDTEEKFQIWEARYLLALTLRKIVGMPGGDFPQEPDNLRERWLHLSRLPRPLYAALYAASISFQRTLNRMIERAEDRGFWPTGGQS